MYVCIFEWIFVNCGINYRYQRLFSNLYNRYNAQLLFYQGNKSSEIRNTEKVQGMLIAHLAANEPHELCLRPRPHGRAYMPGMLDPCFLRPALSGGP